MRLCCLVASLSLVLAPMSFTEPPSFEEIASKILRIGDEETVQLDRPPLLHLQSSKPILIQFPIGDEKGKPKQPAAQEPEYPEGGLQAWLTVLGGAILIFCSVGTVQSFGVFEDFYTRVHLRNHSPSQVSWIGSVQVFLLFFLGIPAGKLFDAGHLKSLLSIGSIIYIFSSFVLSLASPGNYFVHLVSQGFGMGIGMGLLFLPGISIPAQHFKVKRPVAMGVVVAGSSVAAVVKPIILNSLIHRATGFPWAVRVVAIMELALLILANQLVKTRLPPGSKTTSTPFKLISTDSAFVLYLLGSTLAFWGLYIPYFYVQLFSTLHQVPFHTAIYAVSIMNGASIFGRTLPNFAAQRWGNHNVLIPCMFLSGASAWGMLGSTHVTGMIVFTIFYGFFSGGLITMSVSTCASYATHPSEIGLRSGMQSTAWSFAVLTGSPIAGALLSPPQFIWWRPLLFSSTAMWFGTACVILARSLQRRGKETNLI